MSKLKVAIIGVGDISECHIRGYLKSDDVELYAFCDINEAQLKKMGEKYGIERLYTDKDEMFAALPEIDIVSVCTWNSAHAPCTIAALNAGCHVICEKPMAMNEKEALEMQAAAEKNGKLLMIGFVRRFGTDCAIVKEFIDNDYFGELYYGKATYLRRHGAPGDWFGDKSRSGGGPLIDLGVHVIDLTRYLLGNPKPVSVYGATFYKLANRPGVKLPKDAYTSSNKNDNEIFDVEDLATALIRYDNGAVISVEAAFSINLKKGTSSIELFGTKAGCKVDPEVELFTDTHSYMTNVQFARDTALDFNGLFENEIAHFIDCAKNGTECISPAKDGVDLMRILDAIYESARTGHEVVLQ